VTITRAPWLLRLAAEPSKIAFFGCSLRFVYRKLTVVSIILNREWDTIV